MNTIESVLKNFLENYLFKIENNAAIPFYKDNFFEPYILTRYEIGEGEEKEIVEIEIHYYPFFRTYEIIKNSNNKELFFGKRKKCFSTDNAEKELLSIYKDLMITSKEEKKLEEEKKVEEIENEISNEEEKEYEEGKYEEGTKVKENKFKEIFFVQGNYGYGWDDLTAHENFKDAKAERKVYDENENYPHRVISRRIKTEDYKIGKYSKGGLMIGKSHYEGGIKILEPNGIAEVEGGEIIINKEAAKENCELLSLINQSAGSGVEFPCGTLEKYKNGKKVEKVLHEFKIGKLKDSHGNKITDREQAIAIALSQAGVSKYAKGNKIGLYKYGIFTISENGEKLESTFNSDIPDLENDPYGNDVPVSIGSNQTIRRIDKYAKGNKFRTSNVEEIPNNYLGKRPNDIWESWNVNQKEHFLKDHKLYIQYNHKVFTPYNELPIDLKDAIINHISQGQYKYGTQIDEKDIKYWADYEFQSEGSGELPARNKFNYAFEDAKDFYKKERKNKAILKDLNYVGVNSQGNDFAIVFINENYFNSLRKDFFKDEESFENYKKVAKEVLETGKPQKGKFKNIKIKKKLKSKVK